MPASNRNRIRLGAKRQLTLPRRVAAQLRVREGDYLEVLVENGGIKLIPLAMIPRDQLWFWSPEWQAMEREAGEDMKAGRVETFTSAEQLIRSLRRARKRGGTRFRHSHTAA